MENTPRSLIIRLMEGSTEKDVAMFVSIFFPLMKTWSSMLHVPEEDAVEFMHSVLVTVLERLPSSRYDRSRSFQGWLYGVMRNKNRERAKAKHVRTGGSTDLDDVPDKRDLSEVDRACYARELVHGALGVIRAEVNVKSFRAFELHKLEAKPAKDVAEELGMTLAAVHKAVSRIKRRLRTLLLGIVEL